MSSADLHKDSKGPAELDLKGVIGFNGSVRDGLILHPGDKHIIYPLGSTIVIKHLLENTQAFLQKGGHDKSVSCLSLSSSGKYLATGQSAHMGFPAQVIVWDLETYEIVHRLVLHKGKVQDVAFSPNEKYLASLGGRDDNKLVLWDMKTGEAICGSPAASESAHTVRFLNRSDDVFVTGGSYNLRVWTFDLPNRKIRPVDCQLGQLKRVVNSIVIDDDDQYMYCATNSGDVLQVSLGPKLLKASGPLKQPFSLGVTCVMKTRKGNLVVGAGDGTVALVSKETLNVIRKAKFDGGITSLALNAAGDHFFVGTNQSNIYLVNLASFDFEMRNTCHNSKINDVAFPSSFSKLFATASKSDIRVWQAETRHELLRIQVPNIECNCVVFAPDGKSIISGWDDGKIRAFRPQSGTLMYAINDAHRDGVTALAITKDSRHIVSGGQGGQVRVWEINKDTQKMVASMKEHKGRVNSLQLNANDTECVSASSDGSCIVWNLERFSRASCLFASTQFKAILYHPDQSQLLTTGTDRKLTYWDVTDGNPIRIMDGSDSDQLNCLDISQDGTIFVSGGGDKLIRLWGYDDGINYYVGRGHSGGIVSCRISPDQDSLVTVGDEGAIFIWAIPRLDFPGSGESEPSPPVYAAPAKPASRSSTKPAPSTYSTQSSTNGAARTTTGQRRGPSQSLTSSGRQMIGQSRSGHSRGRN